MAGKPTSKYDLELVRSAASSQWQSIHSTLGGIPHDSLSGDNREHPCPKCGGNTRFRMIDVQAGALFCSHCFSSKNGDGFSAVGWYLGCDFQSALEKVAKHLNVAPEASGSKRAKKKADPNEKLEFVPWSDIQAQLWCNRKQPITLAALKACGARMAKYRKEHRVIALPIWGERGTAADPVGWVLLPLNRSLPVFSPGKPVEWVKVKVAAGSGKGWLGQVDKLATAESVLKPEGVTDMLAAISVLLEHPPAAKMAVVSNAFGAGEKPEAWMIEPVKGKRFDVIHDADEPGERGAAGYTDTAGRFHPGWVQYATGKASSVRNPKLPYPITKNHGKDLRDWLNEGKTAVDLLALIEATEPAKHVPIGPEAIEAIDDPHRLAKVFLRSHHLHNDGYTLRFWRELWIEWKDNCWHKVPNAEMRSRLTNATKTEVDRLNIEHQEQSKNSEDDKVKPAIKVTRALVSNVLGALEGLALLSDGIEYQTWIDPAGKESPRRCNLIAMENGILDLDALLANSPDNFRPHSPAWFSPIYLPYPFTKTGKPDKFYAFLEKNLENDPERIQLLQEWAGYLLTPDTSLQKFLFLEGDGANGKSVFMAVLKALIGKGNISSVSLDMFGEQFMLTQTIGKLANIVGDCSELDSVAEGHLKSFVTGEQMMFNRKNKDPIEVCPTARLILSANNRLRFSDKSSGIWRRMHLVPWNVQIAEGNQVRGMDKPEWWIETGEMPAIFCWAVAGLHRLRTNGRFTEAKSVKEAIEDYRTEVNPARAFIVEFYQPDPSTMVRTAIMYEEYRKWCEQNGYRPLGERMFGKEVFRAFPKVEKHRFGGRTERYYTYSGLNLKNEISENEKSEIENDNF